MTRIGMIVPSSNTALEPVTETLVRDTPDVTVHYTRIPVRAITADGTGAAFDVETMVQAATLLADAKVDVIVWNGTAGSWLGVHHDEAICKAITERTGIRATTSTLAVLAACRAFGVERLALATPYTVDVVESIVTEYGKHGIEVSSHAEWELSDNHSFAMRSADDVSELLTAAVGEPLRSVPHAVALVCTNVDGASVTTQAEHRLRIPVFDSIAATVWWALEAAGGPATRGDHGRLLAQGEVRLKLDRIVRTLREETGCDRTTLRYDSEPLGWKVDLCVAEGCGDGVRSIRNDPTLDQRDLNTVRWLEEHRRNLVQPAFVQDPYPPDALRQVYGVSAQMLGPIEVGGQMAGWLSAHSLDEREWSEADRAALDRARAAVFQTIEEETKA